MELPTLVSIILPMLAQAATDANDILKIQIVDTPPTLKEKILSLFDYNMLLGVVVGAIIAFLAAELREKRRQRQNRKKFKTTLCSQFRELQLRLARLCYIEMIEIGIVTRKNLERLCASLDNIQDNKDVNNWRELAKETDSKIAEIEEIKNGFQVGSYIERVRVPVFEMGFEPLYLLEPNHQRSLFSLMTKFGWLNEHIEHYYENLVSVPPGFSASMDGLHAYEQKKKLRLRNAKDIHHWSLNILENITELLEEFSKDN